ncbi:MAG: beta-ketoacyl-ACP synthase II [Verrucomicrobia bacterium]|nr:beta-ketoacyl-ACP synthase II [Verrucomicrobiota bacterium]
MPSHWTDRRVVITGLGVVTPLGNNLPTLWTHLLAGKSGITRITRFDPAEFDTQIAAEVKDFDASEVFPSPKDVRRADRFALFAVHAASQALKDSGLNLDAVNRDDIGVFVGSGIGGLHTTEQQHLVLLNKGPRRMSPFVIPMLILNMASGLISMFYKLRGPNLATCTACATSSHAMGEAWRTILMGDAQVMLAGGSEATITQFGIGGFCAMKAMSTRNHEPERASRPFDRDRDGFVMGEGAGVLVLEELKHAQARGAKIYGELIGYGNSADANHMTVPDPDGDGAARCMRMALRNARINPSEVDYINAHGTSTPLGDSSETKAIKTVFGDHTRRLAVSSTKSATGHMLGAAGAVEMAICCKAIETQTVPPTLNLDHPGPECDLDYVPHTARAMPVNTVINNSFGFGGHNASLVVRKFVA